MKRALITHKNRIPLVSIDNIRTVDVCNASEAYPASLPTPSLWYKADAATASTDTANSNTVDSDEFTRLYDFGSRGIHLNQRVSSNSYWKRTTTQKNTLTIMQSSGESNWNSWLSLSYAPDFGSAGKGTVVMAWKSGQGSSPTTGRVGFQARNKNTNATGFRSEGGGNDDKTTIYGDNQSYSFTTPYNTDCIRIVSVTSSGTPLVYKQNGVQGATSSYDTMSNVGAVWQVGLEQTSNCDVEPVHLYEAMYFETALTATQCDAVEDYLSKKWCIYF